MRTWLSPPTYGVFLISFILFLLVVLVRFLGYDIPVVKDNLFYSLFVAYVILLAGNLFPGI